MAFALHFFKLFFFLPGKKNALIQMVVNSVKPSMHFGCPPPLSGSGRLWTHGFSLVTCHGYLCGEPLLVCTCCGEPLTIPHFSLNNNFFMKNVIYSIIILLYFVLCLNLYTSILAAWIVRIQCQAPVQSGIMFYVFSFYAWIL